MICKGAGKHNHATKIRNSDVIKLFYLIRMGRWRSGGDSRLPSSLKDNSLNALSALHDMAKLLCLVEYICVPKL